MQYEVQVNGRVRQLSVQRVEHQFRVILDGGEWLVDAAPVDQNTLSLLLQRDPEAHDTALGPAAGGASHEVTLTADAASGQTAIGIGAVPVLALVNGRRRRSRAGDGTPAAGGPQRLTAPMPGKVVRLLVAVGAAVTARQPLVVVEAMKMENELRAAADGIVAELHVAEGQSVDAGTLLVVLAPA